MCVGGGTPGERMPTRQRDLFLRILCFHSFDCFSPFLRPREVKIRPMKSALDAALGYLTVVDVIDDALTGEWLEVFCGDIIFILKINSCAVWLKRRASR